MRKAWYWKLWWNIAYLGFYQINWWWKERQKKTPKKAKKWVESKKPETTAEAKSLFIAYWKGGE